MAEEPLIRKPNDDPKSSDVFTQLNDTRPRYRSVLRRPMSLFGPSQVDSIRHIQEERCVLHPCFGAQGSSGPATELTGLVLLQSNPSEVTEHPLGYLD